jgi:hypothetical protein
MNANTHSVAAGDSEVVDEQSLLDRRRKDAGVKPEELIAPRVGLALSGGGIRSATFCLGLLRALAKAGTLPHIDYLSTVSGGGYVGSAFARLYGVECGATVVQQGLARDDSVFLWWLRNNGRYLTPAGMRDVMQALASIYRGALSTHFEVGMLLVVAACVLLLPYVAIGTVAGGDPSGSWLGLLRQEHMSLWWWAGAVPVFIVFHQIFAYWFWRSPGAGVSGVVDRIVAVVGFLIAWGLWNATTGYVLHSTPHWEPLLVVLSYPLLLTPVSAAIARWGEGALSLGEARLKHTKGLALALGGVLIFAVVGAVDVATYEIAKALRGRIIGGTFPSLVALTAVIHWVQTHWKSGRETLKSVASRLGTSGVLNLVGLLFVLVVVLTWTAAVQYLVQPPRPWLPASMTDAGMPTMLGQWLYLLAPSAVYIWATCGGIETLNLSSLHNFYRARLERAYVSCGNSLRFGDAILKSRQDAKIDPANMRVAHVMAGDDAEIAAHRPHEHGGPLHLINCCINQTIDDRTDAYNADRKGVALTVSAIGVETGTHLPPKKGLAPPGNLSMWVAVSGAAASSGMGSQTTPGAAAILFLSGLRLGYWQKELDDRSDSGARAKTRPELLVAECLARFPGLRSPQWYLSDGGHFENTAVYALLKRQVELIVLADCGADPHYGFEDLENLVRKAAIDYCADINFILPPLMEKEVSQAEAKLRIAIGLPGPTDNPLVINTREGKQWLLLGRIQYSDGTSGTLVIVKPRVVSGLPLDTSCYASRNAVFPQQATSDQFFDEAQWEAYHELGVFLGEVLTPENLRQLRAWTR